MLGLTKRLTWNTKLGFACQDSAVSSPKQSPVKLSPRAAPAKRIREHYRSASVSSDVGINSCCLLNGLNISALPIINNEMNTNISQRDVASVANTYSPCCWLPSQNQDERTVPIPESRSLNSGTRRALSIKKQQPPPPPQETNSFVEDAPRTLIALTTEVVAAKLENKSRPYAYFLYAQLLPYMHVTIIRCTRNS